MFGEAGIGFGQGAAGAEDVQVLFQLAPDCQGLPGPLPRREIGARTDTSRERGGDIARGIGRC